MYKNYLLDFERSGLRLRSLLTDFKKGGYQFDQYVCLSVIISRLVEPILMRFSEKYLLLYLNRYVLSMPATSHPGRFCLIGSSYQKTTCNDVEFHPNPFSSFCLKESSIPHKTFTFTIVSGYE